MAYRRCGRSGLFLPAISLGAWETFGGYRDDDISRDCLYRAFDMGITHFDIADNYGTPAGNAEVVVGKIIKDLPRDEMIISSKAGHAMWDGPYGNWGSRKHLIAGCEQSLKRTGLEYFDIFYHHRPDPETPLEETFAALDQLVRSGKVLYTGISSYGGALYADAVQTIERKNLTPITIHQPCYNMLTRHIEGDLLPLTEKFGTGVIAFCPLASGLLTSKYLGGDIPETSRAAQKWSTQWVKDSLPEDRRAKLTQLNDLAAQRGQTLAQLALVWILRLPAVTSALIGASNVKQIEENVAALNNMTLSQAEMDRIEELLR